MDHELRRGGCSNPGLAGLLSGYCFGGLQEAQRAAIEEHLLECDRCWDEIQRLEHYVRILRTDARVKPALRLPEIVSTLGLSGRLVRPFGGHLTFVVAMSLLYGALWTAGLWTELGYAYDRFGGLLGSLSAPVGCFVALTMAGGLALDVRTTRRGSSRGLWHSTAAIVGALTVLVVFTVMVLPAERTILASFQTRTAAAGYLKNALFIFLPPLFFLLAPFHTILQLQRDLRAGRHEDVFGFLSRHPEAVSPRGVFYLSPTFLTVLLLLESARKIIGANYMLDALNPGPYAQLFTIASYLSTAIWLAITVGAVAWYVAKLNDLKRECVAVRRFR
jgi:hypothetical protein